MAANRTSVFDTYTHCATDKYEPWEVVEDVHRRHGVVGGFLVQHLGQFDNSYLIESAGSASRPYRVFVLVDTSSRRWRDDLEELAAEEVVLGVRVVPGRAPAWEELVRASASLGLLPMLFLMFADDPAYEQVGRLAEEAPDVPFILSHLGSARLTAPSDSRIEGLAAVDNILLQLSGLGITSEWPYSDTVPCVTRLLETFGASRTFWGSNFPVCGRDRFTEEVEYVRSNPWELDGGLLPDILSGTALRLLRSW